MLPRCHPFELLDDAGILAFESFEAEAEEAAFPLLPMYIAALPLPGRTNMRFTMTEEDRGMI